MNYKNQETVPHIWEVGDVIVDLYEVMPVSEGFGNNSTERYYHEGGFGRVYKVWHRGWKREMAVKVPRAEVFTTQRQRDSFTRECETWVNLGLHQHITACHYVRDFGGIPRVFSDYAPCGTLEEWIQSKKLYAGDEGTTLARILDLSIQFAWGLHYSHERGLIHQDVKPLNALIWENDTLKVSDFGLAGGRGKAGVETTPDSKKSILVSSGSMTPPYCSPEQAAGFKLDHHTDIWSWAVSVLQMFQGEVIWQSGSAAAHALEYYLENGASEKSIPRMPFGVVQLLEACFQKNPQHRPNTLHECAAILIETFKNTSGIVYKRVEPPLIRDTAASLNNQALSLIDLGMANKAEAFFNSALALDKHHIPSAYNRGLLQWREGKITDAEFIFNLEDIHRELPDNSKLEIVLGWVYMENANFIKARSHFEKALVLGGESQYYLDKANAILHATNAQNEMTLCGHTGVVDCIAFSPDGKHAVSGSRDHTIRLWEIQTGNCLNMLQQEEGGIHHEVAFSQDGNIILSSFNDSIRRWNFQTGSITIQNFSHPDIRDGIEFRTFSNDRRFGLCDGTDPGSFQLWEIEQGTYIKEFYGHVDWIHSMTFSENGTLALTASSDCTVRLWDLDRGNCLRVFNGHTDEVTSVAFSLCARMALSASLDKTLRLWDISTGACIRTMRAAVIRNRNSAINSPFGNIAICGNQLWDVRIGRCLRTYSDTGFANCSMAQCISPDGNTVLSGEGCDIRLRDISSVLQGVFFAPWEYSSFVSANTAISLQEEHFTLLEQSYSALVSGNIAEAITIIQRARSVGGFSKSPQALEQLRYAGARSRIRSLSGAWIKGIITGHTSVVNTVVFSPNGKFALSGSKDKTIRLWDMSSLACEGVLDGKTEGIVCLAISPDSRLAISGINDFGDRPGAVKTIQIWDIENRQVLRTDVGDGTRVNSIAFSPDGVLALSGSYRGEIQLWNVLTGERIRSIQQVHSEVETVSFSPDGLFAISTGSGDKNLKYWDLRTGTCVRKFSDSSGLRAAAFFPDNLHVITASWEEIKIWLVSDGTCIKKIDDLKDVSGIAISPDGQHIVSCAFNLIKLYNVKGELLQTFEGHTDNVNSVQFSPDGRFIISGSSDHSIRLWELDWEYEYKQEHDPVSNRN